MEIASRSLEEDKRCNGMGKKSPRCHWLSVSVSVAVAVASRAQHACSRVMNLLSIQLQMHLHGGAIKTSMHNHSRILQREVLQENTVASYGHSIVWRCVAANE